VDFGTTIADVRAVVHDAYDAAARLLCDSQRLGLLLHEFSIAANLETGRALLTLRVGLPAHLDRTQLMNRLHRHPTVIQLDVRSRDRSKFPAVVPVTGMFLDELS
jgi:hypothetical protein